MSGRRLDPGAHDGPAFPVPYSALSLPAFGSLGLTKFPLFSPSPGVKIVVDGPDVAVRIVATCHPPATAFSAAFDPLNSGRGTITLATKMCGLLICVLPLSREGLVAVVRVWKLGVPLDSSCGTFPIECEKVYAKLTSALLTLAFINA